MIVAVTLVTSFLMVVKGGNIFMSTHPFMQLNIFVSSLKSGLNHPCTLAPPTPWSTFSFCNRRTPS